MPYQLAYNCKDRRDTTFPVISIAFLKKRLTDYYTQLANQNLPMCSFTQADFFGVRSWTPVCMFVPKLLFLLVSNVLHSIPRDICFFRLPFIVVYPVLILCMFRYHWPTVGNSTEGAI